MAKQRNAYTRQGLRDLNSIKGKSVGITLPMPPLSVICNHKGLYVADKWRNVETCSACGEQREVFREAKR